LPSPDFDPRPVLLIVDDDPEVLKALAFMTGAHGFRVERCRTAREAIALADPKTRFACLVIDQRLPDHQGIDLLTMLRSRGVAAPAILITTGPSTDLRRKAAAAGAPIVEKPLLDDALFTQIRRLMARD
jgi:FixJ family two-component response regulator